MIRFRTVAAALSALCLTAIAARGFDEGPPKPVDPEAGPGAHNAPGVKPGNAHLQNLHIPVRPRVMVIPFNDEESTRKGMIDDWEAGYVGRRMREAKREKYDLVVLEIDTGGGEVAACEKINKHIENGGVPVVAFIRGQAFSGGAIVSLGCNAIAMEPGGQVGGAQAVGAGGVNLPSDMREKARAYLTALVTGLCERNDYPKALARGMVDQGVEVVETDDPTHRFLTNDDMEDWAKHTDRRGPVPSVISTWKKKDSILSLTANQAYDANMASSLCKDRNALFATMSIQPSEVYEAGVTPAEKVARFLGHPGWLVLLVVVGLIGLIWELKAPGHGVGYGVFGLCLCVFFWLAIFADTAGAAELILFGLCMLLLGLELFVLPGFGVAGFAGIALVLLSIMLAFLPEGTIPSFFKAPGEVSPFQAELIESSLMWAAIALFTVIGAILFGIFTGIKLPGLSRLALKSEVVSGTAAESPAAPVPASAQPYTPAYPDTSKAAAQTGSTSSPAPAEAPKISELVGKEGVAESVLRPAGKVRLDGHSYDASTEGEWVEAGRKVKVLEVRGSALRVRGI
ncbi:MAG: hypothetical protein HY291_05870 [Planctomycetes bacterium]|nr:hypothetical protein [Planctomycetota bacterium]